jgi:hypothetical protein
VIEIILFLLLSFNFVTVPETPLGVFIELSWLVFCGNKVFNNFITELCLFFDLILPISISFSLIIIPVFIKPFFLKFLIERRVISGTEFVKVSSN